MFFIYLFFGIGVLATLVLMLPSILTIISYLGSLFRTFKQDHNDRVEVRKEVLKKKKEIKLEKVKEKYGELEAEVEEEEKVEEVPEEVKDEVPEVKEEPAHDEPVHEVKTEQPTNFGNPYINTNTEN